MIVYLILILGDVMSRWANLLSQSKSLHNLTSSKKSKTEIKEYVIRLIEGEEVKVPVFTEGKKRSEPVMRTKPSKRRMAAK